MSTLESVLSQYERTQQENNSSMSREERMKKYFTAILSQEQNSGQRRIRILPTRDGSSPFKEAWFHEVQVDGQWMKIYDPSKNDNERSPLTDVYEELRMSGKSSDRDIAKQYRSRKFYIVKVIDRDHPEDGVKFWRFKHNYKSEGPLDKIIPIWRAKGDITDVSEGRDLIIHLTKMKSPNGKPYTVIQTVMHDDPSPLSENKEQMDEWMSDALTWRDVYSKKPVEYLEAIAKGDVPRWDNVIGGYVYENKTTGQETFGGNSSSMSGDGGKDSDDYDGPLPF